MSILDYNMVQKVTVTAKVSKTATIVWVLFLPAILAFYGLQNAETANFAVLNLFFIIYIGSGFGLLLAQVTLITSRNSPEELQDFWTMDIDKNGLKWLGIGIVLVFISIALILSSANNLSPEGLQGVQLTGIAVAGFIMMFAFLKTHAILVPIIIHGVYNGFVTVIQQTPLAITGLTQSQLDSLPAISEIGIRLSAIPALYNEVLWQITIVATAEEFLKIAILVGGVWILNGIFRANATFSIVISAGIAVVFWTYLHTVNALPNLMNVGAVFRFVQEPELLHTMYFLFAGIFHYL